LGTDFLALDDPGAKLVQGGLVKPYHATHRSRDQVELVLDDQVRWRDRSRQRMSAALFTGTGEAMWIVPTRPADEPTDGACPWHGRKFVNRRNQEAGQAAID